MEVIEKKLANYGHILFAEVISVDYINYYIKHSDFYSNKHRIIIILLRIPGTF